MNAIKEFEEIYKGNKNFKFDYEKETIHFSNAQSLKEQFLSSLFMASFFVIMMQIGNRDDFSYSFLGYSILIGILISATSFIGKNEFLVDLKQQVFIREGVFRQKKLAFSEIKAVDLSKNRLNFTFMNYTIELVTKNGKMNRLFMGERDKSKAAAVFLWSQKYMCV